VSDAPTDHLARTFLRGCTKRCGVCGRGRLFRRWFRMIDRCPRCGLRFNRIEGHWTGDIGINTIVSFGALLIVLLAGFLLTWPEPPGAALVAACVATAAVVPLAFLPFSKTIWLAIDLMLRPLEPGEVHEGFGGDSAESTPPPPRSRR
jgi:uncharacterized protein (DUF983 family)